MKKRPRKYRFFFFFFATLVLLYNPKNGTASATNVCDELSSNPLVIKVECTEVFGDL